MPLTGPQRITIISAALLALFLGAMDALIVATAMPTIVNELGGLSLYSWVYSAYFLARAVSLPIFGKLADLYKNRSLFLFSIALFILASAAAGAAGNMMFLIVARVIQGVGSGGIFALVYIVLADVSTPEARGRTLSLASGIWGVASVLGPTLGGFIVTYFSWRWIFFINIPIGLACLWGIGAHLVEMRPRQSRVSLDLAGVTTLTTAVLALLFALLTGGRNYPWGSPPIIGLLALFVLSVLAFIKIEKQAKDPVLSMNFFRIQGFATGNGAVFMSSFAIFSMFAFAPLLLQGAQGRTPMDVGLAMLSLSLGWSLASILLGRIVNRLGRKHAALIGAVGLLAGCIMTLGFTPQTSAVYTFISFFIIGSGMGFVALATLLVVQFSLGNKDLGVATSSNQFARTLGGAVGVGVSGSFIANRFSGLLNQFENSELSKYLPANLGQAGPNQLETLLHPDIQALLPPELGLLLQEAVAGAIMPVFGVIVAAALLCLLFCLFIPNDVKTASKKYSDCQKNDRNS